MITNSNRNLGLDILRSVAIILVFLSHYNLLTNQSLFGPFGQMGGIGVDLFFSLSGYLIGNQIFSSLKKQNFSIKNFYIRRFLRILPSYFVVLGAYFLFPIVRERPLTIPLWKFITFTQNLHLLPGAFSHAWSLCIEEHFYFILPLVALFFARKNNSRFVFIMIISILISEIFIRALIWLLYLQHADGNIGLITMRLIYAPTYTRLDSLVLGVTLALIKNYNSKWWENLTKHGNLVLFLGIFGYSIVSYIYRSKFPQEYFSAIFSYTILAFSSSLLTLSALSTNSILIRIRIPGVMLLATLSYAIYLTHKSFIHISQIVLFYFNLNNSNSLGISASILTSIMGGWLLYVCIEKPFLILRDKLPNTNREKATSLKAREVKIT